MKRSPAAIVLVSVVAFFGSAAAVVAFRLSHRPAPAAERPAPLPSAPSALLASSVAPLPELEPLAIASASSAPQVAPRAPSRGCLCHPLSPPNDSLCAKEKLGPSQCECNSDDGISLCGAPWTGNPTWPTCPKPVYGNTPTAKDGDPCDGYVSDSKDGAFLNTHTTGKLAICSPCTVVDTYAGPEGSRCIGYRNERVPVVGEVDCHNLRMDCNAGDARACTALAEHGAR